MNIKGKTINVHEDNDVGKESEVLYIRYKDVEKHLEILQKEIEDKTALIKFFETKFTLQQEEINMLREKLCCNQTTKSDG